MTNKEICKKKGKCIICGDEGTCKLCKKFTPKNNSQQYSSSGNFAESEGSIPSADRKPEKVLPFERDNSNSGSSTPNEEIIEKDMDARKEQMLLFQVLEEHIDKSPKGKRVETCN